MNIAQSISVGLALREKNNTWLAHNLHVSKQFISKVCKGEKDFPRKRLEELAEVFKVPVSEFIKWGEL